MSIFSFLIRHPTLRAHCRVLSRLSAAVAAAMILVVVPCVYHAVGQSQQKGASIVIHDTTSPSNGGEGATQSLRNEIGSALERE